MDVLKGIRKPMPKPTVGFKLKVKYNRKNLKNLAIDA